MENNNKILDAGLHFDLNQTVLAYRLGGVDKHWVDYTINDDEWDEDKYYDDFDKWWRNLSEDEREKIYEMISF